MFSHSHASATRGSAPLAHAKTSGGAGTHSWRVSTSGTARYIKPFHTQAGRRKGEQRERNRSFFLKKKKKQNKKNQKTKLKKFSFEQTWRGEGREAPATAELTWERGAPARLLALGLPSQDPGHAPHSTGRTKIHTKHEVLGDGRCPASPGPMAASILEPQQQEHGVSSLWGPWAVWNSPGGHWRALPGEGQPSPIAAASPGAAGSKHPP